MTGCKSAGLTYAQALQNGTLFLKECGIEEAKSDAWLLMEHCTSLSRAQYFLVSMEEMPQEERKAYEALIEKRGKRKPLQHFTNEQSFMCASFEVNGDVLIPRQDTEHLVEAALARLKPGQRALDLCTGSGCIAVTLKLMAEDAKVEAADISAAALAVARRNAKRLAADVRFYESDLFAQIEETAYDMIVSNPPYIATGELAGLMPEVRLHEPLLALDGGADGLYFYRRIVPEAALRLRSGGWLLFEIGCDQGAAVSELMRAHGFTDVEVKKDYAGLDRVVLGRYETGVHLEEKDV